MEIDPGFDATGAPCNPDHDKLKPSHGESISMMLNNSMAPPMGPRPNGHFQPPPMPGPDMVPPSTFGASATARISVDTSLAGAIIGKGGVNTKHISRMTGAKLAIRDNEADPNHKNIELEGSFDQVNHASAMVKELILRIGGNAPPQTKNAGRGPAGGGGSNFKTKHDQVRLSLPQQCNIPIPFLHSEN
ncbi:zinc finger CCCH domain-containing protein 44-like [Hordeum vulgare subsp. vulgare]|uniref:zinc finger CCCH domain-containing protein 44-like n=1 Tax=Hordeum vulgare subsp. vulgare TaxID=112509 RepID=UPI001D1A342D|nr:zinc finger CCCH domain-containing protein 44-like [Hordeum vulgare subsp. vulgare]